MRAVSVEHSTLHCCKRSFNLCLSPWLHVIALHCRTALLSSHVSFLWKVPDFVSCVSAYLWSVAVVVQLITCLFPNPRCTVVPMFWYMCCRLWYRASVLPASLGCGLVLCFQWSESKAYLDLFAFLFAGFSFALRCNRTVEPLY